MNVVNHHAHRAPTSLKGAWTAIAGPAIVKGWAYRVFARGFADLTMPEDAATRPAQLAACRQRPLCLDQAAPLFFDPSRNHDPKKRLKPGVRAGSGGHCNV